MLCTPCSWVLETKTKHQLVSVVCFVIFLHFCAISLCDLVVWNVFVVCCRQWQLQGTINQSYDVRAVCCVVCSYVCCFVLCVVCLQKFKQTTNTQHKHTGDDVRHRFVRYARVHHSTTTRERKNRHLLLQVCSCVPCVCSSCLVVCVFVRLINACCALCSVLVHMKRGVQMQPSSLKS